MWVLYFLLAVPWCESAAVGKELFLSEERNGAEKLPYGIGIEKIEVQMEKIASKFLQDLMDAQGPRGNRQRREISDIKLPSLSGKTGVFNLQRIKPFSNVCSRPTDITFVDVGNSSYSVCISTPADDTPITANVVQVTSKGTTQLDSWFTNNPSKAVSFFYDHKVYILVADSGRGHGTDLTEFDVSTYKSKVDHTVYSKHATAIALWKMKTDGRYHLAIANSNGNKDTHDLSTEIFTYTWMGTYFDKYWSISAYDVKDIEPFHIHNMAYLAVANHRRGRGNYNVDSEILKYNLDQNKWLPLQKIRTYGAMDWEFFTLGSGTGKEFFLAVANYIEQGNHDINSVIYKFVNDKFVPFQCILTRGARSIAALSDEKRLLLAIANEYEAVYLYQYNGWRFVPARVQFTQSTMSAGVVAVSFHTIVDYEGQKLVLAVSNPKKDGPSLYELEFVEENALERWHNSSTEWCMDILDEIESDKSLIDMSNVIYIDQAEQAVIDGSLSFRDGFEASTITAPKVIDVRKEITYDNSILLRLRDLSLRLQMIEQRLKKAEEMLRKAVSLKGDQILSGNYVFKDVTFNCEDKSCHFEKIETTFLNGEDFTTMKNNMIFINKDNFVDQPLNIQHVKVNNLNVNGFLDGVELSNVVTKSGSHHITGTKAFSNPITSKSIYVAGLVDGEKVTPYTILLDGGFQNATGDSSFVDLETNSLEVTSRVNNVDLDNFYKNIVLSDKSYIIDGKKTFSDVTVKDLNVKYINGVGLNELWNNVMWRGGAQTITAPMTFSTIAAKNDVVVKGYINGVKIPGPKVILVNSSATINARKIFEKTTAISELAVSGSINGIRVLEDTLGERQLDILLKNGAQVITGHKTFREIFLDDHSYVSGSVNEIDLSELQESAWRKNGSTISLDSWIVNNLTVRGQLTVHGLVSDIDLRAIYDKALKLDESRMPDFEYVAFQDDLHMDDLRSDDINGLDLKKVLVSTKDEDLVKGRQIVTGLKTFDDVNLEADSDVLGLVNKINITFLQESILRLGNQVISTPLTAEGNLRIKNLTVKGLVNNISPAELVTLSGQETITGHKTLSNIEAENIYIEDLEVSGLINDIDIAAEVENTMTYDGEEMISGLKSVTGKMIISRDSNLDTDSLNDVDIKSLWEDAVRIDVPQNISGNKVFSEQVSFGNLYFYKSLDGVTEWDLKHNWMYQDLDQEVFGDLILSRGADVSDITFSGYVNGVSISELNNTIVKKNEPAVINGPVIFENSLISYGDISVTGTVQNVDLSEEAVLKSKHNVIIGEKFLNQVSVTGDVTVSGLIDNVFVEDICQNSVLLNQNSKLGDLTVKGNVIFEGGVEIGGLLSGVDIDALYGLSTSNDESFINGLKTFDNLTIKGPVTLYGKVGGVDIKFLQNTYMSLSRDQEIKSSMSFHRIKVEGSTVSNNFYSHDNKVNGVDIVNLRDSLLKTSGVQSVTATYRFDEVTFADDVIVVGRVNSIEVPKGLMRKNRANYVYNNKVFQQNITVLGDLVMEDGKTVHGIDVSEWENQSVLKDGDKYLIDGLKAFTSVTVNDIWIYSLNGMKISEDKLLMVYGDQSVKGEKEIVGSIKFLKNLTVHGLINGVDLDDIARRAARKYKNNTFSGVKLFSQPITIGTLKTQLINEVDLGKLHKAIYTKLNFDVLSNRMIELKEAISDMQSSFDNQAIILQYYEYFQGFRIPGAYVWHYVAAPDTKELLLLSDISLLENDCTSIRIFDLNPEEGRFKPKEQILLASYVVAMKTIFIWDSTYLFVANTMPSRSCSATEVKYKAESRNGTAPGQIFVWNKENLFHTHQTITMEPATDVAVFSDHDILCVVYTELRDTNLYCAYEQGKQFAWRETLETRHGRKMSLIEDYNDWPLIRLAVAGSDSDYNTNFVDIYNWKGEAAVFGSPIQRIKTSNVQSVAFMLHPNVHSIFLVISEGTISGVKNVPRLLIYKLEEKENKFIKYQEMKDSGYLDWMILPTGDLIFFVLDTAGNINIYRHRYSSFVLEDSLYDTGAKTLHAFGRTTPDDSNHYLALAGPQGILPHEPKGTDFAKILKSNIKGKRLLY